MKKMRIVRPIACFVLILGSLVELGYAVGTEANQCHIMEEQILEAILEVKRLKKDNAKTPSAKALMKPITDTTLGIPFISAVEEIQAIFDSYSTADDIAPIAKQIMENIKNSAQKVMTSLRQVRPQIYRDLITSTKIQSIQNAKPSMTAFIWAKTKAALRPHCVQQLLLVKLLLRNIVHTMSAYKANSEVVVDIHNQQCKDDIEKIIANVRNVGFSTDRFYLDPNFGELYLKQSTSLAKDAILNLTAYYAQKLNHERRKGRMEQFQNQTERVFDYYLEINLAGFVENFAEPMWNFVVQSELLNIEAEVEIDLRAQMEYLCAVHLSHLNKYHASVTKHIREEFHSAGTVFIALPAAKIYTPLQGIFSDYNELNDECIRKAVELARTEIRTVLNDVYEQVLDCIQAGIRYVKRYRNDDPEELAFLVSTRATFLEFKKSVLEEYSNVHMSELLLATGETVDDRAKCVEDYVRNKRDLIISAGQAVFDIVKARYINDNQ